MSGSGTGTPSVAQTAALSTGMNLQKMLVEARLVLRDVGVKSTPDLMLIGSANEAKDEMVQIIRQARQDFFLVSTTSVVTTAVAPNPSIIVLPSDFIVLKDIYCNNSGYEGIVFMPMDRADPRFRRALIDGGSYSAGNSIAYYDLYGNSNILIAPAFDLALSITVDYIKSVEDMVILTDEPNGIPAEYRHYIVAHMVCDALRMAASPALVAWEAHLKEKKEFMQQNIQPRQIKDPTFVRGFMEEESW
jgi:hypothetical protein